MNRRTFLGAAALGALGAAAGVPAVSAQSTDVDLDAWFADTTNYDGVVDERGTDTVAVEVGASGNSGAFAFSPAAVRVDPGTTVEWTWTGEGGVHNVAAEDGSFESDMVGDAGATFTHTFDAAGVSAYACTPHKPMGMKGAVVVGDAPVGKTMATEPDYGDWFAGTENYAGTMDATGQSEVTVKVGASGNGGNDAFEPAAVHVDPGTTVVWEWTGHGEHDVVDPDHGIDSGVHGDAGHRYAMRFDGDGVSKYECSTAGAAGMRGAVVVGDPSAGLVTIPEDGLLVGGALAAALLSPLGFALALRHLDVDERELEGTN